MLNLAGQSILKLHYSNAKVSHKQNTDLVPKEIKLKRKICLKCCLVKNYWCGMEKRLQRRKWWSIVKTREKLFEKIDVQVVQTMLKNIFSYKNPNSEKTQIVFSAAIVTK